jgi:hypothetical protein
MRDVGKTTQSGGKGTGMSARDDARVRTRETKTRVGRMVVNASARRLAEILATKRRAR